METIRDDRPTGEFTTSLPPPLPAIPGYEVLELVGRGGMGKVYRAQSLALGRIVALKVLAEEPDDNLLARFREETRAIASLQHPNIAQVFEAGFVEGRPFYTQEFLEGGTLAQLFAGKPQDPVIAARFMEAVARAIEHSHRHGILHRDLKPANVLLTLDRTPKVTDFGLAKQFNTKAGDAKTVTGGAGLTRTGEIIGTPGYMPPEQASGVVSALGPGTDVYGLGAMLYEALTGRPPFQSPDPLQTVLMVLSMEPVSPRTLQPTTPRDLETICLKCLEKSPRKRYLSAGQLADDLKRFLNGEAIRARPVGFIERSAKWARRNPWPTIAAGLAVWIALGLVGFAVWMAAKNREVNEANGKLGTANTKLETANTSLTRAKNEAETTLGLALNSLDRYFFEFSDALKEIPKGQKLRLEVLDHARRTLDKLGQLRPGDMTIRNYQMTGYDRLGNAESIVGRSAKAEEAYQLGLNVSRGLAEQFPEETLYTRNTVLGSLKLASLAQQTGRDQEADAHFRTAEKTAEALRAAKPDDIEAVDCLGHLQLARYARALNAKDKTAAEPELRKLLEIQTRLVSLDPENATRKLARIDSEMLLASLLITERKLPEAEAITTESIRTLTQLPDHTSIRVRKLRASAHGTLGMLRDNQKRYADAEAEYKAALEDYRALAADFPDNPQYGYQVGSYLWWIGQVAVYAGRTAEARKYFEQARDRLAVLVKDFPKEVQFRQLLTLVEEDIKHLSSPPPPPEKKQ